MEETQKRGTKCWKKNSWGDGEGWAWAPVVWDGRGCRDEGDSAGKRDVKCQEMLGDRMEGLGKECLLRPLLEWDREPVVVLRGSLVQVPTMAFNLFTALGKSLNHSELIHMA